jgi:MoxR-like ATPase
MPWKEIEMGKGFNLIATQNPNKGLFANKRQDLGKKFLSRFHVINFDNFQKEELYQIAKGLGEKNKIDPKILKDLVNFHDEWSNLEERKNDILCFTVREIEATINAISKGENIKEAILIIYGSRYKTEEYNKLKKILSKYKYLNSDDNISKLEFNNEFLYISPLLENVLKAVKMSFDNNRHVMIIGDEGTGKSQIAKFIAEARDKLNDKNDDDGIYYCICTEDLKCSDLIGNQYPSINSSNDDNNTQQLMKWEDGFLTISIIKGKCCILDNIEEAPSTITERLNGLLDKKLDIDKDLIFEIPECPLKKEVKINKNFRLLCICNYNSISKMSPAFLNSFGIITLRDQLKSLFNKENKNKYLELIDTLMKQHCFNYHSNIKK